MTWKTKAALIIVILLVAAAGTGYVFLLVGSEVGGGDARESADANVDTADGDPAMLAGRAKPLPRRAPPAGPTGTGFGREGRPRGAVHGFVESTDGPAAGALVRLRATAGVTPDGMTSPTPDETALESTADARGRFSFEKIPAGAYALHASDATHGEGEAVATASNDPPWVRIYLRDAAPKGVVLEVRVLHPAGEPVPGAAVEVGGDIGVAARQATADERGVATFERLKPFSGSSLSAFVTARARGLAARQWLRVETSGRPAAPQSIDLVLDTPGALEARVRVPEGGSTSGIVVEAWSMVGGFGSWATGVLQTATTDAGGIARFVDLPPGSYTVLTRGTGLRQDLGHRPPRWAGETDPDWAPLETKVDPGETTRVDVVLRAGGSIRGRVIHDADGSPVAGARVSLQLPQGNWDYEERSKRAGAHLWRLDSRWPDEWRHPLNFQVLATDTDGRYAADGLLPGAWRVVVAPATGSSFDRKEAVEVADGRVTELLHRVRPAGTLEAVVEPFGSFGLRVAHHENVEVAFIAPQGASGAVSFPGLAAGEWELVALHSDPSIAAVVLAPFTIVASETTYLDALRTGLSETRVRLLSGGRPASGALVDSSYGGSLSVADEAGRASWPRRAFMGTGADGVRVRFDEFAPWLLTEVAPSDQEVELVAPPGSMLVHVVGIEGRAATGNRVTIAMPGPRRRENPPPEPGEARDWVVQALAAPQRTDAAGTVLWTSLPPGSYDVRVQFAASRTLASAVVSVDAGRTDVTIHEPLSKTLRVRVLDVRGRPQSDAIVSVSVENSERDQVSMSGGHSHPWVEVGGQDLRTGAGGTVDVPGVPYGKAGVGARVMDTGGYLTRFRAGATVEIGPEDAPEAILHLVEARDGR